MKNVHINKLAMYLVVRMVLEKFTATVSEIVAFVDSVAAFNGIVDEISGVSEEVGMGTLGKTMVKKGDAAVMAFTVSRLTGLLHAYASSVKDKELMTASEISPTIINGKRDAERAKFAKTRVELVEAHKADLVKWGVTEASIAGAYATIDAYTSSLGSRNSTATMHTGQRKSIGTLFSEADELLSDQIDKFVNSMDEKHPDFYADYWAARVIKDVAASRGKKNGGGTPAQGGATQAS
jgi:hypothetical protein